MCTLHLPLSDDAFIRSIMKTLSLLDRSRSQVERRKYCSRLAHLLNGVKLESGEECLLRELCKYNAAELLMALLRTAVKYTDIDPHMRSHVLPEIGRHGHEDDMPDPDLELVRALCSSIASYAFLGGTHEIQAEGGLEELIQLMHHPHQGPS